MDNHATAEMATVGATVALTELGIKPQAFVKSAKNVDRLYSSTERGPVMRKAAAFVHSFLEQHASTRGRTASNLMALMSKSADWHESYDDYLREAFVPIMEKRAAVGKKGQGGFAALLVDAVRNVPGGLFTVGALGGGLAGGVAHYAGKRVDEDHVDIEKHKAVRNEYQRLADEIDRKITARALRTQNE